MYIHVLLASIVYCLLCVCIQTSSETLSVAGGVLLVASSDSGGGGMAGSSPVNSKSYFPSAPIL